jgi:hypothetical protein
VRGVRSFFIVMLVVSFATGAQAQERKRRPHKEKPAAAETTDSAATEPKAAPKGIEPALESPRDREARGLFKAGEAAFGDGHFEDAIQYFQRAYDLSHRPILLLNIASAADRVRNDELSLKALEQYLNDVPAADNRAQIEARIAVLREQLASKQAEAVPETVVAQPTDAQSVDKAAEEQPSRVWPWILTGGGAAVLATGGVFIALGASAGSNVRDAKSGSSFSDVRSDYDHAGSYPVLGGVLAGVGALALTGGLVWLFVGKKPREKATVSASFTGRSLVLSGKF